MFLSINLKQKAKKMSFYDFAARNHKIEREGIY